MKCWAIRLDTMDVRTAKKKNISYGLSGFFFLLLPFLVHREGRGVAVVFPFNKTCSVVGISTRKWCGFHIATCKRHSLRIYTHIYVFIHVAFVFLYLRGVVSVCLHVRGVALEFLHIRCVVSVLLRVTVGAFVFLHTPSRKGWSFLVPSRKGWSFHVSDYYTLEAQLSYYVRGKSP